MGKVLVVDDEPHIRKVIEIKLRSAGYEITVAQSADAALEVLETYLPDLLITDLRMPGSMSGADLIVAVRQKPGLEKLPVILLTGSVSIMSRLATELVGSEQVQLLPKPFSPRKLTHIVGELLSE